MIVVVASIIADIGIDIWQVSAERGGRRRRVLFLTAAPREEEEQIDNPIIDRHNDLILQWQSSKQWQ